MRNEQTIEAGEMVLLTSGGVHTLCLATTTFLVGDVAAKFGDLTDYYETHDRFTNWLIQRGYLEEIDYVDFRLGQAGADA